MVIPSFVEALLREGIAEIFVAGACIGGKQLLDHANQIFGFWKSKVPDEPTRITEMETVVHATSEDLREMVLEVAQRDGIELTKEEVDGRVAYLLNIQARTRQTFRHTEDATGTTAHPSVTMKSAIDLALILPSCGPAFKPADRPLAAVDLKLDELLGVGGFGEVWKASHVHLHNAPPVALKFCTKSEAAKLLRHEAGILNQIMTEATHDGIVRLRHTYLSAEPPCLQYDYVEGCDFGNVIRECHQYGGGPTPEFAANMIVELCNIVGSAHQLTPPVVHRDLKPANILVQPRPDGALQLRVTDFGIGGIAAQVGEQVQNTALTDSVHGAYTVNYGSPQQMRGEPPDPRDDVYAIGIIWYQLLTGDMRSGAPTGLRWQEHLRELGMEEEQISLMISCFEPDAAHRPGHAAELAKKIKNAFAPPDITEQESETVLIAIRKAFRDQPQYERDELFRQVARQLGYGRTGRRIREALEKHLGTARQRRIVECDRNDVRPATTSLEDYSREEIIQAFQKCMRKGSECTRDELLQRVAGYFGFSFLTAPQRDAVKSAINSAVRQNMLESKGARLRRVQ